MGGRDWLELTSHQLWVNLMVGMNESSLLNSVKFDSASHCVGNIEVLLSSKYANLVVDLYKYNYNC